MTSQTIPIVPIRPLRTCRYPAQSSTACATYIPVVLGRNGTVPCVYAVDASIAGGNVSCNRHVILPNSREWLRMIVFGRIIPAVIFGYLAWRQIGIVEQSLARIRPDQVLGDFFSRAAPSLFYLPYSIICMLVYMSRPSPHARDSRIIAWAAAFGGTFLIAMVGAFAPPGPQLYAAPGWAVYLITPILLGAMVLAVASVAYLRHSLSVIPEARRVVKSGPYRFVRHPLYLAELTGVGVTILAGGRVVFLLVLVVEIALQYSRARLEERLLRSTFPDYSEYAKRVKAIIPGVI